MGYRLGVRHTAWLILATLVAGVFPGALAPLGLRAYRANAPVEHKEPCKEQVDAEPLKLLGVAQRKGYAGPTRGWLTLRAPRFQKPRPQFLSLSSSYEDPRQVLLPPRFDPPPDGRV